MNTEDLIYQKLTHCFQPTSLSIINESHLHKGHHGSPNTGDSHFRINIASRDFDGMSKIQIHRKIYNCLRDEMKSTIHALSIEASSA